LVFFSFFLRKDVYFAFIKRVSLYIGVILTLRMIILFSFWVTGNGNYSFGTNATINEGDTLYIIAFYQIAFFTLLLLTKKKIYLFLWLFYFLFQILSFRRSALGTALVSNVLLYLFFVLRNKDFRKKVALISLIFISFLVARNINEFNLQGKYGEYVLRFVSAIPGLSEENSQTFNDSGHWEQTTETFYNAFNKLGFWGTGYGRSSDMYLAGQSEVVHNVYAAAWLYYGIYMMLFYFMIIVMVLFSCIKLFLFKEISNTNNLLAFSLSLFLLAWFSVLVTNPLIQINTIKMEIFWVSIFAVLMRIKSTDIIFNNKRKKTINGAILSENNNSNPILQSSQIY
jgi:hypothetical protein